MITVIEAERKRREREASQRGTYVYVHSKIRIINLQTNTLSIKKNTIIGVLEVAETNSINKIERFFPSSPIQIITRDEISLWALTVGVSRRDAPVVRFNYPFNN